MEGFLKEFDAVGLKDNVIIKAANESIDMSIPNIDSEYKIGYEMCIRDSTRWGKARPWVLWSAPPLVVSLIMIFTVPNIGANGKAIYMLLVYIFLAAVCFTASNLSYNTMRCV